jgi:hypothetical protein
MDEIDAALDFRNVSIVANYIKVYMIFSFNAYYRSFVKCYAQIKQAKESDFNIYWGLIPNRRNAQFLLL